MTGSGNGPVDAFVHALRDGTGADIHVLDYHEHAIGHRRGRDGGGLRAAARRRRRPVYGVGLDPNIVTATLKAVVAALNRGMRARRRVAPAHARGAEAA